MTIEIGDNVAKLIADIFGGLVLLGVLWFVWGCPWPSRPAPPKE